MGVSQFVTFVRAFHNRYISFVCLTSTIPCRKYFVASSNSWVRYDIENTKELEACHFRGDGSYMFYRGQKMRACTVNLDTQRVRDVRRQMPNE